MTPLAELMPCSTFRAGPGGGRWLGKTTLAAMSLLLCALLAGMPRAILAADEATGRSIAVMPFPNRGGGENSRYFAWGIHDDLNTALSSTAVLNVLSRSSVETYRDLAGSESGVAREVQVDYLLEGTIQQSRDRIRIDIRLVNANGGERIWEEFYDRRIGMQEIFGIRQDITRSVIQSLGLQAAESRIQQLGQAPTRQVEAYRAVLAARHLAFHGGPDAFVRGRRFAREAIALDPDYSDAQLALALALEQGLGSGTVGADLAIPEIQGALDKALSLDPGSSEAWSALGRLRARSGRQGAGDAFRRSLQLNPSGLSALYGYAGLLRDAARPQEALPLLLRANELDPLTTDGLLMTAGVLDALAAYDEVREVYARIRHIDPSNPRAYISVASSYFPEGRLDEAMRWLRRAQEMDPENVELGGWMVFLNDCLEDFDSAAEWSDWLEPRVTGEAQPMAMQARHHFLTGNFQTSLQYANLALRLGLEDRWNSDAIFMRIKRDEALALGQPDSGIRVFEKQHSGLLKPEPEITPDNIQQATDLSLLLVLAGRNDASRRLLDTVIQAYEQPGFTHGSRRARLAPVKAQALAILGDRNGALDELRRVIDGGWRVYWRWQTDLNANFNAIRDDGRYRAMVAELEADMAEQRARVQSRASWSAGLQTERDHQGEG